MQVVVISFQTLLYNDFEYHGCVRDPCKDKVRRCILVYQVFVFALLSQNFKSVQLPYVAIDTSI